MCAAAARGREPLPLPDHYSSERAELWGLRPDEAGLLSSARDWRARHRVRPAADDDERVILLLVDCQRDFCFPEGSLYVAGPGGRGAVDDNRRIAELVYRHLDRISEVVCTLDSHLPQHIFFASFWVDAAGRPLEANREISAAQVRAGEARPSREVVEWVGKGEEWLARQVEYYCDELERGGRYRLFLWPLHCLVGSEGHALAGVIQEARLFHAFCRGARNRVELKGLDPLTEYYSVFGPEVAESFDGSALSAPRSELLESLLAADKVLIAGQAASHCVRSTLQDLRRWIEKEKPAAMEKIYILSDCTSPVVLRNPESGELVADFSPQAESVLADCRKAGMNVVTSEAAEEWLP